VLTFEYQYSSADSVAMPDGTPLTQEGADAQVYGYDKVIMLAGGVGYGKKRDCLKKEPQPGNEIVVVGGDNYRIGLGGGSVSSVDTGRFTATALKLNAVQRANPEMQKRAYNLVLRIGRGDVNPVVSIHDHARRTPQLPVGAGGRMRRRDRHDQTAHRRQDALGQGEHRQREPGAHGTAQRREATSTT
jgi:phosphoribosylformylglycinamidine (FGAM) synthase-like enzyme